MTKNKAKEALRRRVYDIISGASSNNADEAYDCGIWAEDLSRIVCTLKDVFGEPHENWWGWSMTNADNFATPEKVVDFLYKHGFRANKVLEPPKKED